MLETLQGWDTALFHFFNGTLANPVMDWLMPILTNVKNFYIPYAILFLLLLTKGGVKGRWCALFLAMAVLIADPISSRVLKEAVGRIRPCHVLDGVRLLVDNCGGGKSFPSSHAVNNFAAAVVIGYFYRRGGWLWLILAVLVSFSRVYVGVHYPFDILGGAIIGSVIGAVLLLVWTLLRKRLGKTTHSIHPFAQYNGR